MTTSHTMAVVFDLDGTLVDTMTSAPQAYADTIRSLDGPDISASEVVAVWHIGPTPVVSEHFLGRSVSLRDTERFHRHFADVVASVEPFPGVVGDAGRTQPGRPPARRPHRCHAPSRDEHAHGGRSRRILPGLVGGDEVSRPKPAPDGLKLTCLRLGTGVTDTVYVGDAAVDLQCADAANASGIHAAWGTVNIIQPTAERIAQRPHDVVELVRQLQTR
jgi:phosphoglycolate phosphatase-like HAD superfamily hydrolase